VDVFGPRAIPALAFSLAFGAAHANCSAINGTYLDESIEKVNGAHVTLSSFASAKDRAKLFHTERSGPPPSFGGSGQLMARPKVTRLAEKVTLTYGPELKLRYVDASGKVLVETQNVTPRRWRCVAGRLERKYQVATGLGEVMRTEETEQVLMAPAGGDLVLVETVTISEGPATPPRRTEARFKRIAKS
jgi:hypothetical protein